MSRTIGLRTRLTLTTVPLVLLTMTLLTVLLLALARTLYLDNTETLLLGQARVVAESAATSWGDSAALDRHAKNLGARAGARITIIASDGTVLGDSEADPATMENHAGRPEVVDLITRQSGVSVRYSVTTGRQMVYAAVPVTRGNMMLGVARVAWPLDEVNGRLDLLRNLAVIGIACGGVLAALLAWLLSRYIIRPLDALTGVAGAMAAGDLARRSDPRGTDEIGRLGLAFNRMADELSETIAIISDERAKLAAILETMGDGLLVIDHDGMIRLANSAAERLLQPYARPLRDGRRREVRGRALIAVAIDHELDQLVRETQRRGTVSSLLLEAPNGQRTIRAVAAPARGVDNDATLLVLQDLTEVRRLETARRDFVANISHELRTPLASIKALVETLEGGALDDEEAARYFLQLMNGEVEHLTQLVRELLELSRIESGQLSLAREAIAPRALIDHVLTRLGAQAERQGITIVADVAGDLPLVWADPERIGQVLLNLLHNAIKFTPSGGHVVVGAMRRDDAVAFSVRDSGTGIDPDDLPRIFERFYKADKARSGGGTGLGLAIVKHLVGVHEGTVTAQNNADAQGAIFTFTLPLAVGSRESGDVGRES